MEHSDPLRIPSTCVQLAPARGVLLISPFASSPVPLSLALGKSELGKGASVGSGAEAGSARLHYYKGGYRVLEASLVLVPAVVLAVWLW